MVDKIVNADIKNEDTSIVMPSYNMLHFVRLFEDRFLDDVFKTSSENSLRSRYEVSMPEIDFWINSLGLELSTDFDNSGKKFKNKLFYHLKKYGWKQTKIRGRWSKSIFL